MVNFKWYTDEGLDSSLTLEATYQILFVDLLELYTSSTIYRAFENIKLLNMIVVFYI
jgi:hypothetical protein